MSYERDNSSAFESAMKIIAPRVKKYGAIAAGLLVLNGTWFTIDPTERGNIRRFGNVVYDTPLTSGLHFKIPLVDSVDRIQVSLNTQELDDIDVGTVDNQRATVKTNFVYDLPEAAVNQLLYKTGSSGSSGIRDQVDKTVRAATVSVFSRQNMNSVNLNLETIRQQLQTSVSEQLQSLYKIDLRNMQIEGIKPSDSFLKSNEDAVKAKNAAVAAENKLKTVQYEAQQTVETAKGAADSAIEHARGEAESVRLAAEADKTRLELQGKGEEARLEAEIKAFGGKPEAYVGYLQARAALNWKGDVPQVTAGNGGGGLNLVVPLPAAPRAALGAATP